MPVAGGERLSVAGTGRLRRHMTTRRPLSSPARPSLPGSAATPHSPLHQRISQLSPSRHRAHRPHGQYDTDTFLTVPPGATTGTRYPPLDAGMHLNHVPAECVVFGQGAEMSPSDGFWGNSPTKGVTAFLPLSELQGRPDGLVRVWVHAKDIAGNWRSVRGSRPGPGPHRTCRGSVTNTAATTIAATTRLPLSGGNLELKRNSAHQQRNSDRHRARREQRGHRPGIQRCCRGGVVHRGGSWAGQRDTSRHQPGGTSDREEQRDGGLVLHHRPARRRNRGAHHARGGQRRVRITSHPAAPRAVVSSVAHPSAPVRPIRRSKRRGASVSPT